MNQRISVVESQDAPSHSGPVPQAVRAGDLLFISAIFGTDPVTDEVPTDRAEEVATLLANLRRIVEAAGGSLHDIVQVSIFMTQLQADRPVFNQVWVETFGDHRPARSAVGVNEFGRPDKAVRFMVNGIAYLGS